MVGVVRPAEQSGVRKVAADARLRVVVVWGLMEVVGVCHRAEWVAVHWAALVELPVSPSRQAGPALAEMAAVAAELGSIALRD